MTARLTAFVFCTLLMYLLRPADHSAPAKEMSPWS